MQNDVIHTFKSVNTHARTQLWYAATQLICMRLAGARVKLAELAWSWSWSRDRSATAAHRRRGRVDCCDANFITMKTSRLSWQRKWRRDHRSMCNWMLSTSRWICFAIVASLVQQVDVSKLQKEVILWDSATPGLIKFCFLTVKCN